MKVLNAFLVILGLTVSAQATLPPETCYDANLVVEGYSDDNTYGPFAIGFDFTYFGETKTQFYVSTNGLVGFDNSGLSSYNITVLPNASSLPDDMIAAFWADQNTDTYGTIHYQTIGESPNRKLVVQCTNMKCRTSGRSEFLGTYLFILYETSNDIQTQYRILCDKNSSYVHGNSASIGLENSTGGLGVQYSYNNASLTSEQAIRYTPDGPTSYDIDSSATYEGILLGEGLSPTIPQLSYPLDGSTVGQNVTLSWAASDYATSYEVRYDDESYVEFATTATITGSTQYTIPATLVNGTTYYWMVHAINDTGRTWSEVYKFTASSTPPATLSGNAGVADAVLSYTDGEAKADTADGSGDYSFTVSYNWSGIVTPSLDGYDFTPDSIEYTNVTSDQTDQDYTATPSDCTISGNAGVAGAILSFTDGEAKADTADENGDYSFTVSYDWSGVVKPGLTGYLFAPDSVIYTNVTSDQEEQDFVATIITFTISGNAGVAGALLSYTDGEAKVDSADESGDYTVTVTYDWSGIVLVSLDGYAFVPEGYEYRDVTSDYTGDDYAATAITFTVSGNAGAAAAVLSYTDGEARADTADESGDYSFIVSYNWSGVVTPSLAGYAFTPDSIAYSRVTSNQANQDYTVSLILDVDEGNHASIPRQFELGQNWPNPFNPITTFQFVLPRPTMVTFEIYNMHGQKVATLVETRYPAGIHRLTWDGASYASGVYLYRLQTDEWIETRKMLLLK